VESTQTSPGQHQLVLRSHAALPTPPQLVIWGYPLPGKSAQTPEVLSWLQVQLPVRALLVQKRPEMQTAPWQQSAVTPHEPQAPVLSQRPAQLPPPPPEGSTQVPPWQTCPSPQHSSPHSSSPLGQAQSPGDRHAAPARQQAVWQGTG
jgi:hypothetical protein